MSAPTAPRKGSLQFWPRKRAQRSQARVRTHVLPKEAKLSGFGGYKVGMTHCTIIDNRKFSTTKGQEISIPVTIVECPPLKVASIRLYKKDNHGLKLTSEFLAENIDKEMNRKISLPKKVKPLADIKPEDFDELRVEVYTQPKLTGIGSKKPSIFELAIGGSSEEKINYAKDILGKEVNVSDVFQAGESLDAKSVTKGKGFQGVVKRLGVGLRSHKSEKGIRKAVLGPEGYGKVLFSAPQAGKMGYHQRTHYNSWLVSIGDKPEEINSDGGFINYGVVKNNYMLIKGSIAGPKKRLVKLTKPMREAIAPKEAPSIKFISKQSQQGR